MDSTLIWYVARASGLVAWAVVSASVLWGLALSSRALGTRPRPAWLLDLHRFLGGLAVVFTGVHIVAIVSDTYVHFGIVDVLVPFASSWNPMAVAFGVVALYFLIAVELTSLLRRSIPKRIWKRVHFLSFPLFVLTTAHLLTAGTDSGNSVLRLAVLGVIIAVGALTAVRVIDQASAEHTRVPQREAARLRVHAQPVGSVAHRDARP
jgi:DMSO/TMAO reductase YedYZ heme-binding membrane subunit